MKSKILTLLLGVGLLVVFSGLASGYPLTAALNSAQVIPASFSAGRANCKITYGDDSPWGSNWSYELNCDFSGLSGGLIDADVRYSPPGGNGAGSICAQKDVWVTLPNTGSGNLRMICKDEQYLARPARAPWTGDYVVLQTQNFPDGEVRGQIKPVTLDHDVNGEGRAEVTVFRPSDKVAYSLCGITNNPIVYQMDWQPATDSTPFLADFDGDGIADWAFVRTRPTYPNGYIYMYRSSRNNSMETVYWGSASLNDIPAFGDYDGDGRIDIATFRQPSGTWHILLNDSPRVSRTEQWGMAGDTPCPADYDGDGKADLCVVRPEEGQFVWYIRRSVDDQMQRIPWGLASDQLYPADPEDVDGDGIIDLLVSRVENDRRVFYALRSSDQSMFVLQWGLMTDAVKLGDYDSDGKTDFAAIRETDGHLIWYINESATGNMRVQQWGLSGDK